MSSSNTSQLNINKPYHYPFNIFCVLTICLLYSEKYDFVFSPLCYLFVIFRNMILYLSHCAICLLYSEKHDFVFIPLCYLFVIFREVRFCIYPTVLFVCYIQRRMILYLSHCAICLLYSEK